MATWDELSRDSLTAARVLLKEERWRSCLSRAYFSAYAATAHEFKNDKRAEFAFGGNNPTHTQLLRLVVHHLDRRRHREGVRSNLKRALDGLQRHRIIADYVPGHDVDRTVARRQLRDATFVARCFGVIP